MQQAFNKRYLGTTYSRLHLSYRSVFTNVDVCLWKSVSEIKNAVPILLFLKFIVIKFLFSQNILFHCFYIWIIASRNCTQSLDFSRYQHYYYKIFNCVVTVFQDLSPFRRIGSRLQPLHQKVSCLCRGCCLGFFW